ncbi:SDR family oxidoreductase [Liquorilactobacillus mali]|uniref:SDR family oxidoreductase n=1 Tax=Liquorilactobacillus mali TaxID=1618 RepID=UPI00295385F4|nr:SDR family oxidoreductase [Liquorilactobacillus mali]MDV7758767.1 NAD(P)H-binding protein [Liquorilactobacillus mali]
MKYGVTAATGKFGKKAVEYLTELVNREDIVAFARNTKKAEKTLPSGIEIRKADYTDEKGLEEAFTGISRLLFISSIPGKSYPREKQHLNVVQAAQNAGVSFVAYTSFPHADRAKSPLAADHKITEKALTDSGLRHAFLRNNWYLENETDLIKGAFAGHPFQYSAGDGRVGWALEREYAEAAAKVLVTEVPKMVYEFAGNSLSFVDLAKAIASISKRQFKVESLSDDEYRTELNRAGLGKTADVVLMIQNLIKDGELTENDRDLADVLGREPTSLKEALLEI